jgi:hypothetical protein
MEVTMWTRFMDMHSGGGQKEDFHKCYIEAPYDEACSVFYSRFGHNPDRVTCTCCGSDYSVDESETLEQATGYDRCCAYDNEAKCYIEKQRKPAYGEKYRTVAEYVKEDGVKVIPKEEISREERHRDVPEQGYVWQD